MSTRTLCFLASLAEAIGDMKMHTLLVQQIISRIASTRCQA